MSHRTKFFWLLALTGTLVSLFTFLFAIIWMRWVTVDGAVIPVEFQSARQITLHGTLYLPNGPGPHPAMVLLHGSGPATADQIVYRMHMKAFVDQGIAVLLYDKRGAGRSEGDFEKSTLEDFVSDGLAAISHLRGRPEIDGSRIGILGSSEGGWLTPEIAVRDGDIAFVVNRCGPPLSWVETNLWEVRNELIAAGVSSETKIAKILDLRRRIWQYYVDAAAAGQSLESRRSALKQELASLDGPWRDQAGIRVAEFDLPRFKVWAADISYDPAPWLQQLDVPLFAVFAENDENVPTQQSVELLSMLADDKPIRTLVYPNRTHGMATWTDFWSAGYPSDYLATISAWAAQQVETTGG